MHANNTIFFLQKNIVHALLLKLGTVKQLVKAMDTNKPTSAYLNTKFSDLQEDGTTLKIHIGTRLRVKVVPP